MFPDGGGVSFGPYGTRGCAISTPGPALESMEVEPVVQALEAVLFLVSVVTSKSNSESLSV
jgi:hypothetical protein